MHKRFKKGLKITGGSILGLGLLFCLFLLAIYIGIFGPLPSQEELKAIHKEEASLVLSSDGNLIGKYFAENRTNLSFHEVPEYLLEALIATEDKRFYEHEGYDIRSYIRVFFKTILLGDKSSGGGSTITQQLVKNLYGRKSHSFLSMPISKVKEAIIATRMEEVYTKEEILILYLNSVPFGEEVFGIEAAAIRYFDKHAFELNIQEAAVLVGVLKANTYYNPRLNPENATRRRNQVIALMANEKFIEETVADSLQGLPLELTYANYQIESPAAYFLRQVRKRLENILGNTQNQDGEAFDLEKDGLVIHSTLNLKMQGYAKEASHQQLKKMQALLDKELARRGSRKKYEKSLLKNYSSEQLSEVKKREIFNWDGIETEEISLADSLWHYHKMLHAAVLIAEPASGRVLSWVGGNNYRYLPYDMIYSERQLASSIKPFIYAAGLESGLNPCSRLENEVHEYEEYDHWKPENYNRKQTQDSTIALWYALANSMNLPTVDLYFKTGHQQVADLLRRVNIEAPLNETPSISLGTIDASIYQMVRAYSTLANGGVYQEDYVMIDSISDSDGNTIYRSKELTGQQVISDSICEQITMILEQAIHQGTGTQIRRRFGIQSDLAGKTGTAHNYSNAWFISYSSGLVIGTWVGARSPEMHFNSGLGSGSALALPISGALWSKIERNKALKKQYLQAFPTKDSAVLQLMQCPPYQAKEEPGFIDRLFKKEDRDKIREDSLKKVAKEEKRLNRKEERKKKKEKKEKTKVGKFFERVFKGKKDKDKK